MSNKATTSRTQQIAVRLPLALVAWLDAQPGKRTDKVERILMAAKDAAKPREASQDP